MQLRLKRFLVIVVVLASISMVLVGGMLRSSAALSGNQSGTRSTQQHAWTCSAPPIVCW